MPWLLQWEKEGGEREKQKENLRQDRYYVNLHIILNANRFHVFKFFLLKKKNI
jgi:hypothetical protein